MAVTDSYMFSLTRRRTNTSLGSAVASGREGKGLEKGGHSHGPPTPCGADSQQGDPTEESACPVSPPPKAGLRLLWPRAPCPASPRGSCCGSEASTSGLCPEDHLPERVLCGPLCLITSRPAPDPAGTPGDSPTLRLRPGVCPLWGSQRDAAGKEMPGQPSDEEQVLMEAVEDGAEEDLGGLTAEELRQGQQAALALEDMMALNAQTLVRAEVDELYEQVRPLGQGRFGRVLLVNHRQKGTALALKQLPKASTTLRGFLYEFCVGLSLGSHAAIVEACGIGIESADSYSFLTEPVLHGDLIAFIQPKVGLPQPAAQRCAAQLASALEHIHSLGLVYRDLKPENVLVCDPACRRVKLTDFGHTRPRGTLLRLAGQPIPYTAPELCGPPPLPEGLPIQPALDAWALGVLLFCLLTGYFPWDQPVAEADPFYEDFVIWQASGQPQDRPQPWVGLTPVADTLLWGLLDPHPRRRSPVGSVQGYLGRPWRQREGEAEEVQEGHEGRTE
ncbi:serine/threonine-protein kinase SBK2 isoform X4 [Sus scrofa]|uniref:serine/threonine-protein kinase SBK2 isoform X4 n=1 Tax=Sus scrofa TaxID=9823 RepID=UPI000A2AF880|nr:serine/threonine-protein kinase SBK2 isoform X4 [Sus scrofa]